MAVNPSYDENWKLLDDRTKITSQNIENIGENLSRKVEILIVQNLTSKTMQDEFIQTVGTFISTVKSVSTEP